MELKTEIRQKMTMSARMQQCTMILAMDQAQLGEYITEQAMENPLLELVERYRWLEETSPVIRMERDTNEEDEDVDSEDREAAEERNGQELYFQLSVYQLRPEVRKAAEYVIESLDDSGYFRDDIRETADILGISEDTVREGLSIVQQLEPFGVGASNLEECLLIQMERKELKDETAEAIIRSYLGDYARGRFDKIAERLGTSRNQILESGELIKRLNPKPLSGQELTRRVRYLTADVVVADYGDYYEIFANQGELPEVHFQKSYLEMLEKGVDEETSRYIKERYEKARWLVDCIAKRQDTLMAVAETIMKYQKEFLRQGPSGLQALKLGQVAEELHVHPSTISRAIKNKYIQTSWGIYPLRYFFTGGVAAEEGEVSAAQIRTAISQLIAKEDKSHPLSDSKLANLLSDRGISVSRRSIAAYRQQMNIPSSTIRKEVLY